MTVRLWLVKPHHFNLIHARYLANRRISYIHMYVGTYVCPTYVLKTSTYDIH